jgi:hypothetical protein
MGTRSWIGVAVIIVICAALLIADMTVYRPRRMKLDELNRELAVAESEMAYVAGHASHLARILDFLPKPIEGEGANEGEQQFLSQMVLMRVEPQRVQEDGSYTRRGYKLEVEGGFRQFANFLRYLELMPEVVIVNSFEIHSKEIGRRSQHSATLKVTVIGY